MMGDLVFLTFALIFRKGRGKCTLDLVLNMTSLAHESGILYSETTRFPGAVDSNKNTMEITEK
jgi:hypothetical protein